jgi:flagellar basal-body rod modification protein FlgD
MAIINPLNTYANTNAGGASGPAKNDMDKDTFFRLLITQLQNQNPLNPMDGAEFTSQLAQFSQLEKLDSMNASLDYVQLYLASLNNAQAVDFIGKEIEANGDSVQLPEGGSASLSYELGDDAGSVTVNIYDQDKKLVRTVTVGSQSAGSQKLSWDGKDKEGNQLEAGNYTFEVSASDVNGEDVAVATYLKGVVTGVTFENGVTFLLLGEQKVALGDVIRVNNEEVVAESAPQTKMDKTLDVLEGIGKFMKQAAPIAMMLL